MINPVEYINNLDPSVLFILATWSIIWKGLALWKAGRQNQLNWFIVLLVINIFGILEILYLFIFSKKSKNANKVQKTSKSKAVSRSKS